MKWVTLICLVFCTIATESRHLNKRDAEHRQRTAGELFVTVGKQNYGHIVLVMLGENLQKCSVSELEKLEEEMVTFAERCVGHEDDAECKKPMITLFYDHVCKAPHLAEGYAWSVDCCAKQDPERVQCFHEHRDIQVEPFKRPDVDAACTAHKDHHEHAFDEEYGSPAGNFDIRTDKMALLVELRYIVQIARRHPKIYPPAVLGLAGQYNEIITGCCAHESKEEKETCFDTKYLEILKKTLYIESKQKQICRIIKEFDERVYGAIKLTKTAQHYPGADFKTAFELTQEAVHMAKDCCKGDEIECMVEKMEYIDHICENQEKLSPSLKVCCDKPILERTPCMYALPKDHAPKDESTDLNHFIEDEHVCKNFVEAKNPFMARFAFEFAKSHQDSAVQTCLRVAVGFEALLTKCCGDVDSANCLKAAPQLLEAGIKQAQELQEKNCGLFQKLGSHDYQTAMISLYTPKFPEVSVETLLQVTEKMTKTAAKCCALPQTQIQACAEEKMDLLLGDMCARQQETFINDQVRHCCTDSYANRRPCFTNMGPDPTYKIPAFDATAFQVGADICEGTEDEKNDKRHKLFIEAMKMNPAMTMEHKKELIEEFTKTRVKCCAAENHQVCFDLERPHMLEILKKCVAH